MKYFTAERYSRSQDEVYDETDWDAQLAAYDSRLQQIDGDLPQSVKGFMKTCHLHDADFDKWACFALGHPRRVEFVVRQQNWGDHKYVCVMRYKLAAPGHVATLGHAATSGQTIHEGAGFYRPEFASANQRPDYVAHWLYDEWDYLGEVGGNKIFRHSILLSNGVEFDFIFSEFSFLFVPVGEGFVEM